MLVYRTEKYQKLKLEIEKQSKKLEKKKEAHGEAANLDRSKKRKLEAVSCYSILDYDPYGQEFMTLNCLNMKTDLFIWLFSGSSFILLDCGTISSVATIPA